MYGHSDSGTGWQHHRDTSLNVAGFENVGQGVWPLRCFRKTLGLLRRVYVDEFKMSGPVQNLEKGWSLNTKRLELDPSTA